MGGCLAGEIRTTTETVEVDSAVSVDQSERLFPLSNFSGQLECSLLSKTTKMVSDFFQLSLACLQGKTGQNLKILYTIGLGKGKKSYNKLDIH